MQNITCTRWSLGLYISSQSCQALLLQWCFGRPSVHGFWHMPMAFFHADFTIPDAFFDPIFRSLQDVGASHQLVINIGLEHQHPKWLSVPIFNRWLQEQKKQSQRFELLVFVTPKLIS